jgi:hypothetical protein
MAYDPKSYLDQALKTGFQSVYSQPSSIDESPQYQGDVATFDGIQVRPLSEGIYEGTGDAQYQTGSKQTGYMVSKPLTGQYEGYFLNHLYDNEGNFTGTSISEPDNDKYGLKSLAQLGLMAASFGGLGPIASAAANAYKGVQAAKSGDILGAAASILPGAGYIPGVSKELADTLKTVGGYAKTGSALQKAIENKDILGALGAASDIPGVPKVPGEITDVLKGVGQANRIREAVRNEDPYAIFREVVGASKTGVPFSKLADVTGEDAIEGFFDPGGEGYVDPNAGNLPDWALDPYKDDTTTAAFKLPTDEDYEELESILLRYPEQQERAAELKTAMPPQEMARFLEANIDDPGTIDTLMQEYYPELYRQTIAVTAPKATTPSEPIYEQPATPAPEPIYEQPPTPAPAPSPTPSPAPSPSPAPAPKPATPATPKSGMDLAALFALLGAMGGQGQDRQAPAQVNVARGTPESPFGLMYDLRG